MKFRQGCGIALAVLFSACASDSSQRLDAGAPASRVVHTDLLELAATVRRGGGIVVVGSLAATVTPTRSEILPAVNGMSIEYEQVLGDLSVSDSLGSAAATPMRIVGASGVVRWVNASGTPVSGGDYGSPGDIGPTQRVQASASGAYFLYPRTMDAGVLWYMYWRAAVDASGRVSGDGTRSGQSVDLNALRVDAGQ